MTRTQQLILDRLKRGPADTNQLTLCVGLCKTAASRHINELIKAGKVHLARHGGSNLASLYAIGPAKRDDTRFLRPIRINGRPVKNGFETWLSGLMREAA